MRVPQATLLTLLGAFLLLQSHSALGVVIVDEDFESYADDAAFHVNWAGVAGSASPGTQEEVEMQFELVELTAPNPDFNGSQVVDIADYTIWRDNLGATGASQGMGDATGEGTVDSADYDAWKANFGGAPPMGGSGKAVEHLINFINQNPDLGPVRVPDGVVEYQQVLNPNNTEDGAVLPTAEEPVVVGVDIFDDSGVIQRNTLGLRNVFPGASTVDLVELGFNNGDFKGFAMRVELWQANAGQMPGWQYFDLDPIYDANENGTVTQAEIFSEFGAAWHRWEATIGPTSFTATLDLNRDGINNATGEPGVDATLSFDEVSNPGLALNFGFNNLRFGGPSGLYTTNNAFFDNIYLEGPQNPFSPAGLVSTSVPEPSTLTLLGLVGVGMLAVRRRR